MFICEYSRESEISRGRSQFFHGKADIMLYSGTVAIVSYSSIARADPSTVLCIVILLSWRYYGSYRKSAFLQVMDPVTSND